MQISGNNLYENICSFENLHAAYLRARKGKRYRPDILAFSANAEQELLQLQKELRDGTYRHGGYREFVVNDSKKRHIKAAPFRDRVVHHALGDYLEPLFDAGFIHDTYACRKGKGTRAAVDRLRKFLRSEYGMHRANSGGGVIRTRALCIAM